jgi:hypothetical protein
MRLPNRWLKNPKTIAERAKYRYIPRWSTCKGTPISEYTSLRQQYWYRRGNSFYKTSPGGYHEKSPVSSTGRVQPNLSKTSTQCAIRTTRLQQKQTLPMITNKETNTETGQGGEVMVKEHQTQLEQDHPEGRNKPARKSNEITTTPAWTQRTTAFIPTTGE